MSIRPIAIVFGFIISAAYPLFKADTLPKTLEEKVVYAADTMNRGIERTEKQRSGPEIVSATASGKTLIVKVRNSFDWRGLAEPEDVARMMGQGLCNDKILHELFEQGATMKVQQISRSGEPLPSLKITSCEL